MLTTTDHNATPDTWYAEGLGGCHLDTLSIPNSKSLHDIGYVYLHGELEQLAGFDLICALTENGQEPALEVGKYPVCVAIGEQHYSAMAFIWIRKNPKVPTGLVVILDDTESMASAEATYDSQPQHI